VIICFECLQYCKCMSNIDGSHSCIKFMSENPIYTIVDINFCYCFFSTNSCNCVHNFFWFFSTWLGQNLHFQQMTDYVSKFTEILLHTCHAWFHIKCADIIMKYYLIHKSVLISLAVNYWIRTWDQRLLTSIDLI